MCFCLGFCLLKKQPVVTQKFIIHVSRKCEKIVIIILTALLALKIYILKSYPLFCNMNDPQRHNEIAHGMRNMPIGVLGICLGLTVAFFSLKTVQANTNNIYISFISFCLILAHASFEIKRLLLFYFFYIFIMTFENNKKKLKGFFLLSVLALLLLALTSIRIGSDSLYENIYSLLRYFEYSVVNTNYLMDNENIPLINIKGFVVFFLQFLPARIFESYRRYLPSTADIFPRDAAMGLFGDTIFQFGYLGYIFILMLYGVYFKILYIYKQRSLLLKFLYIYSSFTLVVATAFNLVFNTALVLIPSLLLALLLKLKLIKEVKAEISQRKYLVKC